MRRRAFLMGGLVSGGVLMLGQRRASAETATLLPWTPGTLDIHHIDIGRGNATFILGPDGTTFLIDCGASIDDLLTSAPPRPNGSRFPGEWVARYALHHAEQAARKNLDYIVATHIHPDHVGDVTDDRRSGAGGFTPTGLSQVDQLMPATTVIDRGYPDYGPLKPLSAPFAANYLAWLDDRKRRGQTVEALKVGADRQIRLGSPELYPAFSVRGVAANGRVWTGSGAAARNLFPAPSKRRAGETLPENSCSIALRIGYGRFSYFTGGDLNADTHDGLSPWMDVETPVVRAVGRVEVALADHHGYFDSCGPEFVRRLDAQAYVIPAWHVTHPGTAQLERLIGGRPGERASDVFALEMLPANRLINARFVGKLKSDQGHVVVRVAPGGASYQIFVVDSSVETGGAVKSFGPYNCR